ANFGKGLGRSGKRAYDKATSDDPGGADEEQKSTKEKAGSAAEGLLIDGKRRGGGAEGGAGPYTTNRGLHDKVDDVAWAAFAGGFALGVAMPGVPGLGTVTTANRVVYELPPGELEKRNDDALAAAGVSADSRKAFFLNGRFTPTLQTEMVDALV